MADSRERLGASLAGRYRLVRELRGGAHGLYLAEDLPHGRSMVVHVLQPDWAPALRTEHFQREAGSAAKLRHPHVVPVIDWGLADGLVYYVSPRVEGEFLRDRLEREGRLPVEEALRIARDVARGLNHGHEQGVVHGLVQPENILVTARGAAVTGFGIAAAVLASRRAGPSVPLAAAPLYSSPEQADPDGDADGRADLYGLGCVLYEMLAGRPPYTGSTRTILLSQHKGAPIPDIGQARPDVSPGIRVVLRRALAKAPGDRHPTGAALALSLEEEMASRPDLHLPPEVVARGRRRRSTGRRAALVWIALASLALAVALALRFLSG